MTTPSENPTPSIWTTIKSAINKIFAPQSPLVLPMKQEPRLPPEQEARYQAAKALHEAAVAGRPKRADYPSGPEGDELWAKAMTEYAESHFENPTAEAYGSPKDLAIAQKMAADREKRRRKAEEEVEKRRAEVFRNVTEIDPGMFADMPEEKITTFAPYATPAQLRAVMAARHWSRDEKMRMLGDRWEEVN